MDDFRASGSGNFNYDKVLPDGLLNFCNEIYKEFNIPSLSLDIAYDGNQYYLIEFQAVYFGTYTLEAAPYYFQLINNKCK